MPRPPPIGLYGGSFDPVHLGHVALAESLRDRFSFREIRLLPAACSPLKVGATADQHRLAMLELALKGKQGLTIDDREMRRPPPSYTIDTLREIRHELGPGQPLVFILGQDSFAELPRWKDWQQLTDLAHLLVVNRPGSATTLPDALRDWLAPRQRAASVPLEDSPHGGVWQVETPPHDIASRTIRAAIRTGKDTSRWLNPAVADYIAQHHLYMPETQPPDESA